MPKGKKARGRACKKGCPFAQEGRALFVPPVFDRRCPEPLTKPSEIGSYRAVSCPIGFFRGCIRARFFLYRIIFLGFLPLFGLYSGSAFHPIVFSRPEIRADNRVALVPILILAALASLLSWIIQNLACLVCHRLPFALLCVQAYLRPLLILLSARL